jgi:alcohol dehydrogenase, propanol-preferring
MAIDGIPAEMLAVQITEFNTPYKIHKVPTPNSLKEYEVLLKTVVASLCHTDSIVVAGKFPIYLVQPPMKAPVSLLRSAIK